MFLGNYGNPYDVKWVPPDERPGVDWLFNLGKGVAAGAGLFMGARYLSSRPSLYKTFIGTTNKLKNIPIIPELKEAIKYRRSVIGTKRFEFEEIAREEFRRKYAAHTDDMESLLVEDILSGTVTSQNNQAIIELQNGRRISLAQSEYDVLREAQLSNLLDPKTRLGRGLYKDADGFYDLRSLQLDRLISTHAKDLARVVRFPILNFGPLDFMFTDLWAAKPFFAGRELSLAGSNINATNPFYIGGDIYDSGGEGIRKVASGYKIHNTAGNIGYSYGIQSGAYDEMLFGPQQLYKHKDYENISYDRFLQQEFIDLVNNPEEHYRKAKEVFELGRDIPELTKKAGNVFPDYNAMYSRQEGWIQSVSRAVERVLNPEYRKVLIDQQGFNELSVFERTRDSIIGLVGGETEHIKWLNREQYNIWSQSGYYNPAWAGKRVGHSTSRMFGYYNVNKEDGTVTRHTKKYVAYNPEEISEFSTAMHYVGERIQRLPEAMTGIGIRPSKSVGWQFARQLTHVVLPVMAGWYGVNLVSDIMGGLTFGYGDPMKAAAHGYAGALLAKQTALNVTGVSYLSQHMEDVMPGTTDSLLAEGAFVVGGMAVGARIGNKFGRLKTGGIIGTIAGIAMALGNPAQKATDLYDELTGKKLVPVKKNRGWMLGRQDFKGDEVKYYKPHWYRRFVDDLETKARYGSNFNYWMHGSIPGQFIQTALTPFGIGNNYWLEEKGPWAHTYPISNPILQDVPFVGPLLEWGVGSLLKPYRYYVPKGEGWAPPYKYPESGLTWEEMRSIGIEPLKEQRSIPMHPFSLFNQIGNFIHNMEQYTGLIGWGLGTVLGNFNKGEQLESFHSLYGAHWRYYSQEIGGAFGQSEYLRRFIPKRAPGISYYNPLPYPYTMEDKIPGTKSIYEEDKTYPIDLYYGGPTKIPYGEMRLPGPGAELMYQHKEDTIDEYLMMSYLAPGTRAHKDMRTVIKSWIKSGAVDSDTARELGWAQWSISEKLERMKFSPLKFSAVFDERDEFYKDFTESLFSDNTFGEKRFPDNSMAKRAMVAYNKVVRGNRWSTFNLPIVDDVLGKTWETLTHADIPIPMIGTMLTRKLIHNRTALEEYEYSRIYSNSFASWDNWFTSIFTDTLFNFGDLIGLDIKPGRVRKESEIIEYLDSVKYQKYRQLEQQALLYNNNKIASKMAALYKQTIIGMDTTSPFTMMKSAFRAMPGPDKPFLKDFMFAPYSERDKIMSQASPHMAALLARAWQPNITKNYRDIMYRADRDSQNLIRNYSSKYGKLNSVVWHPGYDLKRERIRMARREALDIHRFGDWGVEEIRYNDGFVQ